CLSDFIASYAIDMCLPMSLNTTCQSPFINSRLDSCCSVSGAYVPIRMGIDRSRRDTVPSDAVQHIHNQPPYAEINLFVERFDALTFAGCAVPKTRLRRQATGNETIAG